MVLNIEENKNQTVYRSLIRLIHNIRTRFAYLDLLSTFFFTTLYECPWL